MKPEQLDAIQAIIQPLIDAKREYPHTQFRPESEAAMALLAYARDLEARVGRVEGIVRQLEVSAKPPGVEEFYAVGKVSARVVAEHLRAALTASDAS